jgi:hypothetical protein
MPTFNTKVRLNVVFFFLIKHVPTLIIFISTAVTNRSAEPDLRIVDVMMSKKKTS